MQAKNRVWRGMIPGVLGVLCAPAIAIVRLLVTLLLVALFLSNLAACQPGSTWSGSVKIGLVVPFYGYDSGSANAAYFATKLALRERNEKGGIAGRWIELIALDDQNDSEVAAHRAREIALDPDVMGVIGSLSSDTALGAAPAYRDAGLGAITLGGSAVELASLYPDFLRMTLDDAGVAERSLKTIRSRMKVTRTALLYDGSTGHASAADSFAAASKRQGLDISAQTRIARGQREFGAFLDSISPDPPELLIFVGDQFQAASLVSQARKRLKIARILVVGCANTPDFAKIVGEGAIGVLHADSSTQGTGSMEVVPIVANNQFDARYRSAFGLPPAAPAFASYDATVLLLNALERVSRRDGSVDRPAVSRELGKLRGTSDFGLDGGRSGIVSQVYEFGGSDYPGKLWP